MELVRVNYLVTQGNAHTRTHTCLSSKFAFSGAPIGGQVRVHVCYCCIYVLPHSPTYRTRPSSNFVFQDAPMEDKFYEGFCKTILWPLFHSSMPTTEDTIASHDADSIEEQREEGQLWLAYKARFIVNRGCCCCCCCCCSVYAAFMLRHVVHSISAGTNGCCVFV